MTDGRLIPRNRAVHPVPYDPDYKTSVTRSPNLPLLSMPSTITEETGPVFGQGLHRPARQQPDPQLQPGEKPRHWRADPAAWPGAG